MAQDTPTLTHESRPGLSSEASAFSNKNFITMWVDSSQAMHNEWREIFTDRNYLRVQVIETDVLADLKE